MSINAACKIFGISQSAYYYKPKITQDDHTIKAILLELASKHSRWGFAKMMNRIKKLGCHWNHKRVYRVYCEMELNIRIKPKKRLPRREASALTQPIWPNICWSMDFMSDALESGQKFRTLNVIDDYNRQALLIKPLFSLPASYVTQLLDQIITVQCSPKIIRVDNGPEFISSTFKEWANKKNIIIQYIQPGKPAQNGFIERFNRTYRQDILDMYIFSSIYEVEQLTNEWIESYNNIRPHESLANLTPCEFAAKFL